MMLVFKQFRALGSACQVHRWFHAERIELPANKSVEGRFKLLWQPPTLSFVGAVLRNRIYAGAYTYGRRPIEVVVEAGQASKERTSSAGASTNVYSRSSRRPYWLGGI